MKKGYMDLHMHSTYSDGTKTPIELLDMAKERNITTMAITDHDEITGAKELVKHTDKGLYLYSGIELTAATLKGRMHILGYNIDLENENLNKRIISLKEDAIYNILLYIEFLKKDYGVVIPEKDVLDLVNKIGNVGRPQIALLLVKYGYCHDVEEAFLKYLVAIYERVRKIKRCITKEECISLIKNAGGVVSLAHPSSLKMTDDELENEVIYLKSLGMEAIEVIHIHNSPEQRAFYNHLAKKYNLLISGGTDYHGEEVKPEVEMGTGINGNVVIYEGSLSLTKNIKSRYMRR